MPKAPAARHAAPVPVPPSAGALAQPVWLLAQPQPLREVQMRPVVEGHPVHLLAGPERVESGWWDAELAERDYFIAQTRSGALVWLYRSRLPTGREAGAAAGLWFLHGRFG